MRPSGRRTAIWVVGTVLALTIAGCSGGGDGASAPEPAQPMSAGTYVMSGLERPAGSQDVPVLVVKVENTHDGQIGVDEADLVTELPVEGGLTRLAAFYESEAPERVGPVRSARNSDIGLVKPANAVLVASGMAASTRKALEAAGLTLVLEDSPAITKDPSRPTSYNLFADLSRIRQQHMQQLPTGPYLSFGEFTGVGGKPVKKVGVTFSGSASETWTANKAGDKWNRSNRGAYAADTLLILKVDEEDAGYVDAAGSSVPIVISTGKGPGWIVTGGQAHKVEWSKASDDDPWQIHDAAGNELMVPPGKTWISLIPNDTGKVTFS